MATLKAQLTEWIRAQPGPFLIETAAAFYQEIGGSIGTVDYWSGVLHPDYQTVVKIVRASGAQLVAPGPRGGKHSSLSAWKYTPSADKRRDQTSCDCEKCRESHG